LFGLVLDNGNLLLVDVVDEGLSLIHVDHHDLLTGMWWPRISGHWHQLRDGWHVKLVDKDSDGNLSASRTKLQLDVRCNIVVVDEVVDLASIKFILNLADFQTVGIHVLLIAVPRFVDLVEDHRRVVVSCGGLTCLVSCLTGLKVPRHAVD
jgi:hypothetical protein